MSLRAFLLNLALPPLLQVYTEPHSLGLDPLLQSWMDVLPKCFKPAMRSTLLHLFDVFLQPCIAFLRRNLQEPVPTVDNQVYERSAYCSSHGIALPFVCPHLLLACPLAVLSVTSARAFVLEHPGLLLRAVYGEGSPRPTDPRGAAGARK